MKSAALLLVLFSVVSISGNAVGRSSEKPFLHVDQDGISSLRQKIRRWPVSLYWAEVNAAFRRLSEKSGFAQANYSNPGLAEHDKAALAKFAGFIYLLTGSETHRATAVNILLNTGKGMWPGEWYHGLIANDYALAYDWVGKTLAPEQHTRVQNLLAHIAHRMINGFAGNDQQYFGLKATSKGWYLANSRLRADAGLGTLALALDDYAHEKWGASAEWLEFATQDLFGSNGLSGYAEGRYLHKFLGEGGLYKEGMSYQNDVFELMTPFFLSYKKIKKIDFNATTSTRKMYDNNIKLVMPDGAMPTFDTTWLGAVSMHEVVAAGDDNARQHMWLWDRMGRPVGERATDPTLAIIYFDESAFANRGPPPFRSVLAGGQAVVLRSGWQKDANYLLLLSENEPGRTSHEQPDQTSFAIHAKGVYLAIDPGDGRSYEPTEHARHYWVRSPRAHNLILVDDDLAPAGMALPPSGPGLEFDHERVKDPARIKRFVAGSGLDFATVEMDYSERRARVERSVFFPGHEYFVVVDRLQAAEEHDYDFLVHFGGQFDTRPTETGKLLQEGRNVRWRVKRGDGKQVELQAFFAAPVSLKIEYDGGTNLVPGVTEDHVYLRARQRGRNARFLTILYPRYLEESDPEITHISGEGFQGARVSVSNRVDEIYTRLAADPISSESLDTDSSVVFIRSVAGRVRSFAAFEAKHLDTLSGGEKRLLLRSSTPVTASIHIHPGDASSSNFVIEGTVKPDDAAAGPFTLTIGVAGPPRHVTWNGEPASFRWNEAEKTINIRHSGRGKLRIVHS